MHIPAMKNTLQQDTLVVHYAQQESRHTRLTHRGRDTSGRSFPCSQRIAYKGVSSCQVDRASPLAKLQSSPDAKCTQQVPGGNAAGVQPALFLLQASPQLTVLQRLNWQQGGIMGVAIQHKAVMLCSSTAAINVAPQSTLCSSTAAINVAPQSTLCSNPILYLT